MDEVVHKDISCDEPSKVCDSLGTFMNMMLCGIELILQLMLVGIRGWLGVQVQKIASWIQCCLVMEYMIEHFYFPKWIDALSIGAIIFQDPTQSPLLGCMQKKQKSKI